ncbi:MAG TPA: phosphatase PAP2 family protein [Polyangiaceae bacterium]
MLRLRLLFPLALVLLSTSSVASAQTPAIAQTPEPPNSPQRKASFIPHPVEEIPPGPVRFAVDPVGDGAMLGIAGAFDLLSDFILGTGEVRPQQIDPKFNSESLFFLDRGAVSQKPDANAATLSNVGLYTAIGFAVLDPILSGIRDGKEAMITDAFMYLESIAFASGLTDIAKVAVRRPRPIAYIQRNQFIANGGDPATYDNTSTDSSLSFFSGHASAVGAVAGTATYLAFARSPHTARPWITLLAGIALTSFVSVERVRAAAHFPTDVIAGSLVGAGTGVLVVHLHRADTLKERPIWIGFQPMNGDDPGHPTGGLVTMSGLF